MSESTSVWISLLAQKVPSTSDPLIYLTLTVLAVIVYYFGKLISKALPARSERFDIYLQGALFVGFFIVLPLAIFISVYEHLRFVVIPLPLTVILLLLLIRIYWSVVYGWKGVIKRMALTDTFQEHLEERVTSILEALRFAENFGVSTKVKYWVKKSEKIIESLSDVFSSFWAILVVSLLTVTLLGLTRANTVLEIVILGLIIFLLYTILAIAYGLGQAYYPPVIIVLNNGQTIEGTLYKQNEDSVVVIDPVKRELVEVPYSQIVEIRQSALKHRKPKPKTE